MFLRCSISLASPALTRTCARSQVPAGVGKSTSPTHHLTTLLPRYPTATPQLTHPPRAIHPSRHDAALAPTTAYSSHPTPFHTKTYTTILPHTTTYHHSTTHSTPSHYHATSQHIFLCVSHHHAIHHTNTHHHTSPHNCASDITNLTPHHRTSHATNRTPHIAYRKPHTSHTCTTPSRTSQLRTHSIYHTPHASYLPLLHQTTTPPHTTHHTSRAG